MQEKNKKKTKYNLYISTNENDTVKFATNLAKNAKPHDIYCLIGDLGVGKTVIAKSIGKFFNVNENVTSPTFTILKSYDVNKNHIKKINHFDLYRIKSIDELYNIGFEDIIYDENAITIIEWPEIAMEILTNNYYKILIEKVNISNFNKIMELNLPNCNDLINDEFTRIITID